MEDDDPAGLRRAGRFNWPEMLGGVNVGGVNDIFF